MKKENHVKKSPSGSLLSIVDTVSDLRPLQSMQSFAFKGFLYWNCEWLRTGTVHVLHCTDRWKYSGQESFLVTLNYHLLSTWKGLVHLTTHKSFCKKEFLPHLRCVQWSSRFLSQILEELSCTASQIKPLSFFKHFNVLLWLEAHLVAYEKIEVFFRIWKSLWKGGYCFMEILK